jgi:hypothetical protein
VKELKVQVEKLTEEEAERSMIKFPLFNSTHEGYAVIKEEIEEAAEELKFVSFELDKIWDYVRRNRLENALAHMKSLKIDAMNLAAEAIQVSAMAQKFIDSFKEAERNE